MINKDVIAKVQKEFQALNDGKFEATYKKILNSIETLCLLKKYCETDKYDKEIEKYAFFKAEALKEKERRQGMKKIQK